MNNDSIWTDNEETNDQAFLHSENATRSEQLYKDPPLEKEIAQVVAFMLGVSSIDVDKNIFEAGADSLTVARLSAYLSDRYPIDVPLHAMFKEPTAQGLARMVDFFSSLSTTRSADGWSWKAEHLEAATALDSSITPDGLPEASYLQPTTVFLTGATGYVGAFLLDVLLEQTNATIYCLVRAKDPESGLQRIQHNLQHLRTWNADYCQRIRPVCGDLGLPWLGLSPATFSLLAQNVDAIYHCGGQVNLSYPYEALKNINVLGTQEILRLACHTTRKAVHYISNADVHRKARMSRPFLEADLPRQPRAIPDGYIRTKWVSEQMIIAARDRGLPVTIHRPGFLLGHSQTGACSTTNYLLLALRGFLQLGVFPQLDEIFNVALV
ncbi:MAG TPA: thioester reductase domain-containing protein, partial [Ktedonobacteraceae bacterium]|nr:thioester reductase domain-containing protein [Ktedonobacteraceae bacterium]